MDTPHAICARVEISYPRTTQYPEGNAVHPAWNREQVNKIAEQSPLFERQVLRLTQDSSYVWRIVLKETDEFHDIEHLATFIVNLGRPQERNSSDRMEVNSLSSRCSAMWHFEVLPSKVHLASCATDVAGRTIASNSPIPTISSTPTVASGDSPSPVPTTSESSGGERQPWCWDNSGDHQSPETSLKLANIALVLGWKEVFRREIKTVIWNWPRHTTADNNPSIHCLQKDGAPGVTGLQRRREREMKEIKDWFNFHFANDPKLPQQVKGMLQQHSPNEFDDQNPYSWMRSLENTLLPNHQPPRRHTGISQTPAAQRGHNHNRGGDPPRPKISKVFNRLAVKISDPPENKKFIMQKLQEAHEFIEKRQNKVAEKLLAWREGQVARWTYVLEERYPSNILNGMNLQASAGGSTEGEEQQQQSEGSPAEEAG